MEHSEDKNQLFEVILNLNSIDDCYALFEDLCTYKEVEAMAQRIHAAKLLLEKKTYEQIIQTTEISSATLSRVSRCVQFGKGYKQFIK